jgi:hypothetical protein
MSSNNRERGESVTGFFCVFLTPPFFPSSFFLVPAARLPGKAQASWIAKQTREREYHVVVDGIGGESDSGSRRREGGRAVEDEERERVREGGWRRGEEIYYIGADDRWLSAGYLIEKKKHGP